MKLEVVNKLYKLRWSTCGFFRSILRTTQTKTLLFQIFCCFSIYGRNLRHTPPEKTYNMSHKKGGPFQVRKCIFQGIDYFRGFTHWLRLQGGLLTTWIFCMVTVPCTKMPWWIYNMEAENDGFSKFGISLKPGLIFRVPCGCFRK